MRFWTVDVSQIVGAADRDGFEDEDIERMAIHILAAGGLVRPLVLKGTNEFDDSYRELMQVVSGHLDYWAAARAKELEPSKYGMVNAFVLNSPLQVKAVIDQIEASDMLTGCDVSEEAEDDDMALTLENARLLVSRSISALTQANLALSTWTA
jgi:hypothetical protein